MTPEQEAKIKADKAAAEADKLAKEKADKAAAEAAKLVEEAKIKELAQDAQDYTKFAELHLLMCDENGFDPKKIKKAAYENYQKLEKKFKEYKGKKPKKTANVFMGLGLGTRKIVKGYGVPETIHKEFVDAKIAGSWF